MCSYEEYYDVLEADETKHIIDVDDQIYYCVLVVEQVNNVLYLETLYRNNIIADIGTRCQSVISKIHGPKKIDYIQIYDLDYIIRGLGHFIIMGLAAIKVTPKSLLLKTRSDGVFNATDVRVISIDRTFDKRLLSSESFCRAVISHNIFSIRYAKNITDEMIRYLLKQDSSVFNYAYRYDCSGELNNRVVKIIAKYKV